MLKFSYFEALNLGYFARPGKLESFYFGQYNLQQNVYFLVVVFLNIALGYMFYVLEHAAKDRNIMVSMQIVNILWVLYNAMHGSSVLLRKAFTVFFFSSFLRIFSMASIELKL